MRESSQRADSVPARIAVVNDYLGLAEKSADWSAIRELATVDFFTDPFDSDDHLVAALSGYDIICSTKERLALTASLIDRLPQLKLFVATSQVNHVTDFAAAAERGIEVAGTGYSPVSRAATAEYTWGLIIAAMRGITTEDRRVREGRWQTEAYSALFGKTIGIVGLGGTGRYIARFAHAFGMRPIAWSPHLTDHAAVEANAESVGLDELLISSDVVTLHLVLSDSTRHVIDAGALALMKESAVLVNTSRGGLIDEDALVAALQEKRIRAAALDTFDVEPLPENHALLALENTILTPHAAGYTTETYDQWYRGTAEAVLAYLQGRPIPVRHDQWVGKRQI